MSRKLEALLRYLDGLQGRGSLESVKAMLIEVALTCDDAAEHVRFDTSQYQRSLVRAGRSSQM